MVIQTNELAPDFELPNARGGTIRLSNIVKDKIIVLIFYRGSWCPICVKQLTDLTKDYNAFREHNAEILAISNEDVDKGQKLLKKIKPPFQLLQDPKNEVISTYGLLVTKRDTYAKMRRKHNFAIPAIFIVDRDRKICWMHVGKTYKDRPTNDAIIEALLKFK